MTKKTDTTLKEQFIQILKNGDLRSLKVFLQSLSTADKNTLKTTVKQISRDLNKYYMGNSGDLSNEITQKLILSEETRVVLELVSFVSLNFDEIKRSETLPSLDILEEYILEWYQPSWLNKYFLELANFYFDYEKMLSYMDKGWLVPTKQFIADNAAYGLLDSTDRLEENIWYLFEYYTTIGNDDRWIKRFKILSDDGSISREKLLRETLLTSNRGFNKPITGWFCKLLSELNPTKSELLILQEELFASLASPHGKAVGDAVKYLKKIANHSHFKIATFINNLPILLTWNVKSIVNSTLTMVDVLIKVYPDKKEALGLQLVQTLAQEDESLQVKTAKLLAKHKLLDNETIHQEIVMYADGLYSSTKEFLPENENIPAKTEKIEIISPQYIREDNYIIYPESFDEMVFFFSQAFEGNNVYDFDLFVALLPKLYLNIDEKNITKLEPCFNKALKYLKISRWNGYKEIIVIMAQAFVYFWYKYIESFDALYEKFLKTIRDKEDRERTRKYIKDDISNFETKPQNNSIFNVHHQLLVLTFAKIENKITYTPLWTTTHSPCWIDASILTKRLETYEKHNYNIHPFELQIALSKTIFDSKIVNVKNKELNSLLDYLQVNSKKLPIDCINNSAYWLTAVLRKNNVDDLELFARYFQKEKHDVPFSNIFKGKIEHKNSKNTTFSSHCVQLIRSLNFQSVYQYTRVFTDDLPYVLALTPLIPQFILESRYKTPQNEFAVMMPILLNIWGKSEECNYLFIARTFTDMSKIARQFTSELWIKATQEGTMNHALLGETLGKLEHNEYAPLKRLTDLVVSNMLNISTLHNQGLRDLLSAMIAQMNDEPIKGTKKLLEIYLEVLSLTELDIPSETMEKLNVWGEVKSLKSVVNKIK